MPSGKRILARMRQTKHGWGAAHLAHVLEYLGLTPRESGHSVFRHPEHPDLFLPVSRHTSLPPGYVKCLLDIADKLEERNAIPLGDDAGED
jgi:hypothetical protein